MSLLRQIQDAAIDSSVGLPSLLRKCKVLAARLGSEEFKRWIEYELSGYPNKDQLPDYRVFSVNSKGHFSGPLGSGLRNADIPLFCIPEDLRELFSHCYLTSSVAAMESLVSGSGEGPLHESWSPDIVAYVGQRIYERMNCMQAWKVIPKSAVVAALDAIRTRVLNFVLEIESENPSAGEAALNSNPLPMEKVNQIFNTYITGTVQNLAPGSSNFQQTATYTEESNTEVFSQLLEAVKSAGLQSEVSRSVEVAVEEMQAAQGTSSFKQRYQTFISLLSDHIQILGPVVGPYLPTLTAMMS